MKKIATTILFLVFSFSLFAQWEVGRSRNNTVVDDFWKARYSLGLPRYADTSQAMGLDTCGRLISTFDNKIWKRNCNPKMWEELGGVFNQTQKDSVGAFVGVKYYRNLEELRASTAWQNGIITAETLGYYDSADGGAARYIFLSSSTDADDSSFTIRPANIAPEDAGRYKLSLTNGVVNLLQLGGKADYVFGVADPTDNYWPITKGLTNAGVARLDIPANTNFHYYYTDTIRVSRLIELAGGGRGNTYLTGNGIIVMVNNCYVHDLSFLGIEAAVSTGFNSSTKHGVHVRSNGSRYERVGAYYFDGDGFSIYGNMYYSSNANNNSFKDCQANFNGRHGMGFLGPDANNCLIQGGDFSSNARWGIYDGSFLGNNFYGVHTASNGHAHNYNKTIVTKGGTYYAAIVDNINYPPDSTGSDLYWQEIVISPLFATVWNRADSFFTGGGYIVPGLNATSVFNGCYAEPDQVEWIGNGRSDLNGGVLAALGKEYGAIGTDGGYKVMRNIKIQNPVTLNNFLVTDLIGDGSDDFFYGFSNNAGDKWGFYGDVTEMRLGLSNLTGSGIYFFSSLLDPTISSQWFGTTSAPNGTNGAAVFKDGIHLGVDRYVPTLRLGYSTAPPTTNWHMVNEFQIYAGSDSTILGFRCIASGTPGAWRTIYTGNGRLQWSDTLTRIATNHYVDSSIAAIPGSVSYWSREGGMLSPSTITDSVGIGTSTPSYPLDVTGNVRLNGYVYHKETELSDTTITTLSTSVATAKTFTIADNTVGYIEYEIVAKNGAEYAHVKRHVRYKKVSGTLTIDDEILGTKLDAAVIMATGNAVVVSNNIAIQVMSDLGGTQTWKLIWKFVQL